jgi:hypothetical protein
MVPNELHVTCLPHLDGESFHLSLPRLISRDNRNGCKITLAAFFALNARFPSYLSMGVAQRAFFYFVDLGEKRFFEFGNGSHIPHDFAFFFISHFIPGKQHNRRFPDASISHAFSIRRLRVSCCLAELIEKIQSRRAIGVISAHDAFACGAALSALRRSIGTLISGSSPARVISTVTVSPASAPAASCMALITLSP